MILVQSADLISLKFLLNVGINLQIKKYLKLYEISHSCRCVIQIAIQKSKLVYACYKNNKRNIYIATSLKNNV